MTCKTRYTYRLSFIIMLLYLLPVTSGTNAKFNQSDAQIEKNLLNEIKNADRSVRRAR